MQKGSKEIMSKDTKIDTASDIVARAVILIAVVTSCFVIGKLFFLLWGWILS